MTAVKHSPTVDELRNDPFVSMSRMDYGLAPRIFQRPPEVGITDEELDYYLCINTAGF